MHHYPSIYGTNANTFDAWIGTPMVCTFGQLLYRKAEGTHNTLRPPPPRPLRPACPAPAFRPQTYPPLLTARGGCGRGEGGHEDEGGR